MSVISAIHTIAQPRPRDESSDLGLRQLQVVLVAHAPAGLIRRLAAAYCQRLLSHDPAARQAAPAGRLTRPPCMGSARTLWRGNGSATRTLALHAGVLALPVERYDSPSLSNQLTPVGADRSPINRSSSLRDARRDRPPRPWDAARLCSLLLSRCRMAASAACVWESRAQPRRAIKCLR